MRAIVITKPGGPEVLQLQETEAPEPAAGQILVRVAATAINRADLLQRAGRYPAPHGWPADIPGLEYAGTVVSAGDGVTAFRPADRVMGLVGGGAYAEFVAVHQDEAMRVPATLTLQQAAAIPEAFITAHDALISQAGLSRNETVLIHAAGSGVGTAAVQIAKAVGATTIGTSRSAWKLDRAVDLGLDAAVLAGEQDFVAEVGRLTGGRGADVVLDLVGGDYLPGNIECLAVHGRIIIVGLVAGATAELDMRALMRKRASIRGTVLRSRLPAEKAEVTRAFATFALPHLESGRLRPIIDSTLPLEQAGAAHERMQEGSCFGKIVLEM